MHENRYDVYYDGNIIAEKMILEYALLFVKAIFEQFHEHPSTIAIKLVKIGEMEEYDP